MPFRTFGGVRRLRRQRLLRLALAAAALAPLHAEASESAEAREQARLCERSSGAAGVEACRAALALGVAPERRPALREQLARQLVALEDWEALAELYREGVRLEPRSAAAWRRLGLTLLFALSQPNEAVSALEQAVAFAPESAEARLGLAEALSAARRPAEAAQAFDVALRLDARCLDGRPAARAAFAAARRGEPWP